jgi:hypothetical protein
MRSDRPVGPWDFPPAGHSLGNPLGRPHGKGPILASYPIVFGHDLVRVGLCQEHVFMRLSQLPIFG